MIDSVWQLLAVAHRRCEGVPVLLEWDAEIPSFEETHAEALGTMRRHGRKPMSMTHGDFDEGYLRRLALRPDGTPRFRYLVFAAHFDHLMFGLRLAIPPRGSNRLSGDIE